MFEKLRNAFSNVAKNLSEKELNESDIEDVLFELELSLLDSDVATEVIDSIKLDLNKSLIGAKIEKNKIEKFIRDSLISNISKLFDAAGHVDLFERIDKKKQESNQPYLILFVGINGTGKTTTLAKIAYMLKQAKYSVAIAASDTFRAGAIEQLREHTNRLNLKLIAQNYNSDPAAVARDAVLYAKSHKTDCVLIDTAGRMQTNKNLMEQITKITKVVTPDMKIFVGDSLAGNDTVNQAREFFAHTKFDCSILTKGDADARGGAALSIVKITSTPVVYVGVGQEYPDLKPFDKQLFLETVFGSIDGVDIVDQPTSSSTKVSVPVSKPKITKSPEQVSSSSSSKPSTDPFAGIDDSDIKLYSELFDVSSPQNDDDAIILAERIREWISNGRPEDDEDDDDDDNNDDDDSKSVTTKESVSQPTRIIESKSEPAPELTPTTTDAEPAPTTDAEPAPTTDTRPDRPTSPQVVPTTMKPTNEQEHHYRKQPTDQPTNP